MIKEIILHYSNGNSIKQRVYDYEYDANAHMIYYSMPQSIYNAMPVEGCWRDTHITSITEIVNDKKRVVTLIRK